MVRGADRGGFGRGGVASGLTDLTSEIKPARIAQDTDSFVIFVDVTDMTAMVICRHSARLAVSMMPAVEAATPFDCKRDPQPYSACIPNVPTVPRDAASSSYPSVRFFPLGGAAGHARNEPRPKSLFSIDPTGAKEAIMLPVVWIGALLFICGIVLMARTAIFRGEMSEPHASRRGSGDVTLEPRHRGLRFLGVAANWPGIALAVVGGLMLLWGATF
jgi:hypothetical protein